MTIPEFDRVAFVGGGTMGCFNSLLAAVAGYQTVVYDVNPAVLEAVPMVHEAIGAHLIEIAYCTEADIQGACKRVSFEPDLASAVSDAGLVSESVPERLGLKREVFAQLDALCSAETLLTSNTSALLVSDIDSALTHGGRFAALHSHFGALLFDIVAGPRCTSDKVELLERYVRSLRGEPLVLKRENPGYVFNALLGSVLAAAKWEVISGGASLENIDRGWMARFSVPLGPFGLMDLFGLDVVADSWREPREDPLRTARQPRVSEYLQGYINAGRLGRKSGAGFYYYPDPAFSRPGFTDTAVTDAISPLLAALIDAALVIEERGVATRNDIDRAWCTALGMKQGPFSLIPETETGLPAR